MREVLRIGLRVEGVGIGVSDVRFGGWGFGFGFSGLDLG